MSIAENPARATVLDEVVALTAHLISDWDLELAQPLGPAVRLVEHLDFDSIDLVCLFVAIEERYEGVSFGFENLVMVDGQYVEDLPLRAVADFVSDRLEAV